MAGVKSALPTHLKPNNGDEAEFTKRHHGKTRSHMVSVFFSHTPNYRLRFETPNLLSWQMRTNTGSHRG